jgi:hypothetical protein
MTAGPEPRQHPSADDASPRQLTHAMLRLAGWLLVVMVLVIPVIRRIPVGRTGHAGIFAWMLVVLALYWLYAGLGYRGLLLLQLFLFSIAATLLSLKGAFVAVGVHRFSSLRELARLLVMGGGACAVVNLAAMAVAAASSRRSRA